MSYLTQQQLEALGFKRLGKNIKISDKAAIYDTDRIEIGDNSRIDDFCVVSGQITIGRNVHIAPQCLLAGGERGIFMGDFSGLAYGVKIFTQSDDYSGQTMTNPTVPKNYKMETMSPVNLGRHVIVGASALIFPGVSVAEGCSVGAMALVNKSTEPWGIYVGRPARRMKARKRDLLRLESLLLTDENHNSI